MTRRADSASAEQSLDRRGRLGLGLSIERRVRIDRSGSVDLTGRSGQLLVVGVASQVEQQKCGEHGPSALLGLAVGLVDAQCAE